MLVGAGVSGGGGLVRNSIVEYLLRLHNHLSGLLYPNLSMFNTYCLSTSDICENSRSIPLIFIFHLQRSHLKGWTQKGLLSFAAVINTVNVELPPQTVLDVDVCEEFGSNVSIKEILLK